MAVITSTDTCNLFLPENHFMGRENFLKNLHTIIVSKERSSKQDDPLSKMTVIHGPAGMGKTSVVLKYAQDYQKYYENVIIFINAATEQSTIESFLVVAQKWKISPLILEKNGWTNKRLPQIDVVSLVNSVYRHFSNNFKSGLFIFDNAHRLETKSAGDGDNSQEDEFGVQDFLPKHGELANLINIPNFLVTSSSSSKVVWECRLGEVTIVEIGPLDPDEGFKFLNKALGVKSDGNGRTRQGLLAGFAVTKLTLFIAQGHLLILPGVVISGFDLLNLREFHDSIKKLVTILQGYPLALRLAMSVINVNWNCTGFSLTRYKVLNKLVKDYIKIIQNQLSGVQQQQQQENNLNENGNYNEKNDDDWEILTNGVEACDVLDGVLIETVNHMLDSIHKSDQKNSKIIQLALKIFNTISYLPPDSISVELCHALISNVPFSQQFLSKIRQQDEEKSQDDDDEGIELTRKAIGILNQYGIVCVSKEPVWSPSIVMDHEVPVDHCRVTVVKIHRLVQKWRLQYVKKSAMGAKSLEGMRDYFEKNDTNLIVDPQHFINFIGHHVNYA